MNRLLKRIAIQLDESTRREIKNKIEKFLIERLDERNCKMIVEELLSFHRLEKSLYNYKAIAQKLTNSSNYLEPLLRNSFDFYFGISRKALTSAILNKYPSLKESSENNLSIRKFINKFISQTLANYIKDNIERGFYQERDHL